MNKTDTALAIGATFDWITPLWGFLRDAFSGPTAQINIPYDNGLSGAQIGDTLADYGIDYWAMMVVWDEITFTIHAEDEAEVREILAQS